MFFSRILSFQLTDDDIITGDDGLLYRNATAEHVNLSTCEVLCSTAPGFRVPQANDSNVMEFIKKRKYFKNNNS